MTAAALIFREALEVWLVAAVVLAVVDGSARQHAGPLLLARFSIRRGQFQRRPFQVIPAAKVAWWSR